MRKTPNSFLFQLTAAVGLILGFVVSGTSSQAQSESVAIASEALPQEISQLLAAGRKLEGEHRWGEALAHYEQAVRKHPEDRSLAQRYDIARLHYGVERRYVDRSYLDAVSTLDGNDANDLYNELLLKIDSHYVVNPPWNSLARRGVQSLDVALTKTNFLRHNNIYADKDQLLETRRAIYGPLSQQITTREQALSVARQVAKIANQRVQLRPSAVALEFTSAAAEGLDHYSSFLSGNQLKEIYSQIEGNFVGLGVELKAAPSGGLEIVNVIPGSPAERANIEGGDIITAINGKTITSMSTDEAAGMLTGEEGTYVEVHVVPPHAVAKTGDLIAMPKTRTPFDVNVRREHVDVPSLEEVGIIDEAYGVAYARVPVFQKTTSRDLEQALWDLHSKGMRTLVLDLRGNPGGLLTASVELADKFVAQGRIVSTRGRSAGEDFDYTAHRAGTWRVPLVVLIDDQSASASEIFAAAIHDNRRGTVVGERSFGKGSVQGIFPLGHAGAGIRLTTAKFFSPTGQPISKVGVQPDIVVRRANGSPEGAQTVAYRGDGDDQVLARALEVARSQVVQNDASDNSRR
ncbi:S41 family peptidase [Aeoliella mucimassa]|uniref:Putative CtpA-like serine protease n=1 Tax=Aeoliella mucimassa TaxID=2527972 RepID=A0A518ASI8_9BACT|nr:S41 family peptidase [Aeoliella mucimassa]QDU57647.1 putative CtpA-like serine protease [Aeoliella mucimassa]